MKREPAKCKNYDQAENCFCHFSTLFKMFTEGDSQAAIPPVQHLTSHEGVEDRGAHQGHAEIEAKEPPVLRILVELHELRRGIEHTGFVLLTPVFKGHHDEADSFRDGQHEREDPDGDDLDGSDQGNPDPLNTTPGGDGSVPVNAESAEIEDGDPH